MGRDGEDRVVKHADVYHRGKRWVGYILAANKNFVCSVFHHKGANRSALLDEVGEWWLVCDATDDDHEDIGPVPFEVALALSRLKGN
jgi:hypothetical protein